MAVEAHHHRSVDTLVDEISALMETMARLMPHMLRKTLSAPRGAAADLTEQQFMTLLLIDRQGPLPMATLHRLVGGAQSSLSELVGRLAKIGLLKKSTAPEDSRVVVVSTTARGRKVLHARREHMRAHHRVVLEALSPSEQERFVAAFRTVITLMTSALGEAQVERESQDA